MRIHAEYLGLQIHTQVVYLRFAQVSASS